MFYKVNQVYKAEGDALRSLTSAYLFFFFIILPSLFFIKICIEESGFDRVMAELIAQCDK